jgi:hypothetical protein
MDDVLHPKRPKKNSGVTEEREESFNSGIAKAISGIPPAKSNNLSLQVTWINTDLMVAAQINSVTHKCYTQTIFESFSEPVCAVVGVAFFLQPTCQLCCGGLLGYFVQQPRETKVDKLYLLA